VNDIIGDGGPAFPWGEHGSHLGGMTLRDYFAAKAMVGIYQMVATREHGVSASDPEGDIAKHAYQMADAMLKARQA
jgi:hypothetical protein